MVQFVCDLPKEEKFKIYKQVKGLCLWEGIMDTFLDTMWNVLDSKVKDVLPIVDYEMAVDYMEVYKDYSYGRY